MIPAIGIAINTNTLTRHLATYGDWTFPTIACGADTWDRTYFPGGRSPDPADITCKRCQRKLQRLS